MRTEGLGHMEGRAITAGVDRRWHSRWPSGYRGRVVFDDQSPALGCTVQNMSPRGGEIVFTTAFELPPEFELVIPSLDLRVEARAVWSRAEHHGVTFLWPQRTPWA
jgi:hypothetical protein